MGLDMYLYKTDMNGSYDWNTDEIGYWRKANQIHLWFVKNVQNGVDDCGDYVVSRDKVIELLSICDTILNSIKMVNGKIQNGYTIENGETKPIMQDGQYVEDSSIAEKLLPTTSGFFFGSTDYDEWYVKDLEETKEILEHVLNDFDFENNKLVYSSSW